MERTLAESKHFRITHEYEQAFVINKTDGMRRAVCRFYGDPHTALIDRDERFAVICGCGILVYDLAGGRAYSFGFEKGSEIWTETVTQNDDGSIEVTDESRNAFRIKICGDKAEIHHKT